MLPRFATLLAGLGLTGLARAPQRAVTIGRASPERLYARGLDDKLAGTSRWFNNVQPEDQAQNAKVPRLAGIRQFSGLQTLSAAFASGKAAQC